MATLRKRVQGSVNIAWAVAQDGRMSYTALGVLVDVLSRPDGWEVSAERMSRSRTGGTKGSGREAILSAFRELESLGYRRLVTENGEGGRIRRWAEFSDAPVEAWAAAAAGDQARRSKKPQVTPKHGMPYDGNDGSGRPGETAGGTETRDAVVRDARTSREITPEGEHTHDAASAPTDEGVCESPTNFTDEGARAEIGWDVTPEQVAVGEHLLTVTVHPEAAHLIGEADRDRLAAKAGALLARGWSSQLVERVLARRTNAQTVAPVVVLERALNDAIKESLTTSAHRRGLQQTDRPGRPPRAKLNRALAAADRLYPDEAEFAKITAWLKRASAADVEKWLAEHDAEAQAAPLHIPQGNAPATP
jgi:hypothetical protein